VTTLACADTAEPTITPRRFSSHVAFLADDLLEWEAFLDGPYNHPNDDLTQANDWAAGARFAEANYRSTRVMADGQGPPWIGGDCFGDTFAPNAPRAPRAKQELL
jgi:hypothetical protein